MKYLVVLLLFFTIVVNLSADRGVQRLKMMKEEQRVALVVGNNNYNNLSILKNPINDARLMKSVLKKRGFEVIYKENATKNEMKKLVKKFAHKLKRGGIGLYYFAGHGVSVDGRNYLVGTNSLMEDKDEVEYETLALNYVTKKMKISGNRLNIIILDACRNDPFSRSGGGGLAPVSNAKGIFIAYATEAGSVASDGKSGKNGIFTKYLVKNLQEEGATIERVFKNTRADVHDATNGTQSPGVYNQIRGDFFFTLPTSNNSHVSKIKKPTKNSSFSFQNEMPTDFSLTINQTPSDAKVSITNIKPRYYDGIRLKKGIYNIKVSKSGYTTKRGNINLESNIEIAIDLEKKIKQINLKTKSSLSSSSLKKIWKDKDTDLIWQVKVVKKTNKFNEAKAYCKNLTLDGYSNWKLPNLDELKSIITEEYYSNAKSITKKTYIKKPLLDSMDMKYPYFWNLNTLKYSTKAWELGFHYGKDRGYYTNKRINGYIRCVVGKE